MEPSGALDAEIPFAILQASDEARPHGTLGTPLALAVCSLYTPIPSLSSFTIRRLLHRSEAQGRIQVFGMRQLDKRYGLIVAAVLLATIPAAAAYLMKGEDREVTETAEAELPLRHGYYKGQEVAYIITEVSNSNTAKRVNATYAPSLAQITVGVANFYRFTNGAPGQLSVLDTVPGDPGYSPLWRIHTVTWKDGGHPELLTSEEEVLAAAASGSVTVEKTDVIANYPVLFWPGGEHPGLIAYEES